jgi:glycosyltransferase involved in cell wall biosynthesis
MGLVLGLVGQDIVVDVIGGSEMASAPVMQHPRVNFKNLHGTQAPLSPVWLKCARICGAYLRIAAYAAKTDSRLIHIQWPFKLVFLDRTLLNLYFKMLGQKVVYTAHNVDGDARDGTSTWLKRFSLRFLYRSVDHIIVHTELMRLELMSSFGIAARKISVIPHGVMSAVPETTLSRAGARERLHLGTEARVVLFFGLISRYKGVELLVEALARLRKEGRQFTLLIAGRIKECQDYWDDIYRLIKDSGLKEQVVTDLRHVPDECVEVYFKAADVVVLPYKGIFQSGVLFLAYRFGLPVIATDVGSFKEDIIEGRTGLVCRANDPADLAKAIESYFASDLFNNLESRRADIRNYAFDRYSWSRIGEQTRKVYEQVLGAQSQGAMLS